MMDERHEAEARDVNERGFSTSRLPLNDQLRGVPRRGGGLWRDSPYAPLPPNYPSLSPEEKREARLAVFRHAKTPDEIVLAWAFFRRYYLAEDPMNSFYKRLVSSPLMHYQWIYMLASSARNMIAAPRSFGKSIVVGKEWPLFLAVALMPGIDILIVVSEKRKAQRRGAELMRQLQRNKRIVEDFGDLRGRHRQEGRLWGLTGMNLTNGSSIYCSSIGAHQLGERPDVVIWDDVEPDPEQLKEGWAEMQESLMNNLFNVYLPMLDAGTAMTIIGTIHHRRSFLYWACYSNDPRLGYWNRFLGAIDDRDGNPTWPEKFPPEVIARLQKELGFAAFSAQYRNAPIAESECILHYDSHRTGYDVTAVDDAYHTDPLSSKAIITYYEEGQGDGGVPGRKMAGAVEWQARTITMGELARGVQRFIAVDYATGDATSRSDFSVIAVMGVDGKDRLWVLDLWMGRVSLGRLCEKVWQTAFKWKVGVIGIESIGPYQALLEQMRKQRGEMEKTHGWVPRLKRVKYPPSLSKEVRIAALEWRFDEGQIKINNANTGAWPALRYQIENFTMSLVNLRYDDAIDCVAMSPYIVLLGRTREQAQAVRRSRNEWFAEQIRRGRLVDPATGLPYLLALPNDDIPVDALVARRNARHGIDRNIADRVLCRLPREFTLKDLARVVSEVESSDEEYESEAFDEAGNEGVSAYGEEGAEWWEEDVESGQ